MKTSYTMNPGQVLTVWLLCCCGCVRVVTAIQRTDLFPYGSLSGDLILAQGDDETSKVLSLPRPLYFYDTAFTQLYVATNGIISAQDLPMEKQYVDDGFPTDFPVVAPFLADIDTSNGHGQIFYRVTETPSVLNRVAQEVHRGFPDARFTPTHAVVATWENVASYEDDPKKRPSDKVNTFQAVIGYDETDSYVVFLYPQDGLNFFEFLTRPKESYNVEIELPARVGFSRGEVAYFLFSRTEGPHYSVTSDEQSVKNLYQVGNTGTPGVWLFHTGNRHSFDNIVPASFSGLLATPPPRGYDFALETTTPEYAEFEEYPDNTFNPNGNDEDDYPLSGRDPEFHQVHAGRNSQEPAQPSTPSAPTEVPGHPQTYNNNEDVPLTSEQSHSVEPVGRQYAPPPRLSETVDTESRPEEQQPQAPLEVVDVYPPPRTDPHLSPGGHVVSVDEDDVDFDTGDHPRTHCEHHRDSVQTTSPEGYPIVGAYVPQCDESGHYTPQQCDGSTGHCWCVDNTGQERPGTRTPPGTPSVDCNRPDHPRTHCEHHRDSVQTTSPEGYPILGPYVPQCDENGQYLDQQCHGSTGYCWCVDSTGRERPNTRTPPGTPSVDCTKPDEPQRPKTHCEHHRDRVQTTSPEGYPLVGVYVPQCDASGHYTPQQCHGSTGHCWCVNNTGQERPGTKTPPGTPSVDCDRPGKTDFQKKKKNSHPGARPKVGAREQAPGGRVFPHHPREEP